MDAIMDKYTILPSIVLISVFLINYLSHQQAIDPCENAEPGESVRGPINCAHYIVCDVDNPRDQYCPDGLYFNPEIQDCDDPDYVECGDEYEYESEEEASDEYDGESEAESDEDDRGNDPPVENGCPRNDDPTQIVFLPSTKSCIEFFICYYGVPLPMNCTNNLHFNAATNRCDFPRNANCRVAPSYIPTTKPKCDRDIYMEVYPHPTQCDYYYFCRKGYLSIQQCPFFYYFDPVTKMCKLRDGTQC